MPRVLLLFVTSLVCLSLPAQKPQAGPWARSKVPAGWVLYETKNYQIQSEVGIEKAERLGKHMEVMNKVYRRLFRPGKDGAKLQVIKLLKSRDSYLAYGAPPSSAAYYSRYEREMVTYDTGKWSDEEPAAETPTTGDQSNVPAAVSRLERRSRRLDDMLKMDILGCAAHEGWHQYFAWLVVSQVTPLPSWINEGMGDYFYTAAPKSVRGRKVPADLGRMNEGRLLVLKAAIAQDRTYPLERLVRMSKEEFYNDGSVCYAQGWALCQFLLHSGNKKYEKLIPNFIRYVKDDSNMEAVTDRTFKGIDFAELDAEFRAWVDTLKLEGIDDDHEEDGEDAAPPMAGDAPVPTDGDTPKPADGSEPPPPAEGGR
jgi:hypothetical protein